MPYQYIENIATADAAFRAWGATAEEMFISATDALVNVMVVDPDAIRKKIEIPIHLQSENMEMLLYELLQEIIFYKDAEQLLLRALMLQIDDAEDSSRLDGTLWGEKLDPSSHDFIVDVKAVTFHRYRVEKTEAGWEAMVVVDV